MYTPPIGAFWGLFTGVLVGSCVATDAYHDIRKHNEQMTYDSNH